MLTTQELSDRTIKDFGEQWARFTRNEDYYGSLELFSDLIHPFLTPDQFRGARVIDIGSGTGRIVQMLAAAGAEHVVAVEPAPQAHAVLLRNTANLGGRVTCLPIPGERIPPTGDADFVVSFGVLHHIPAPAATMSAAYQALRPGGRMLIWLYGREGNELYLNLVQPLRRLTTRLPAAVLHSLSWALYGPLRAYVALCRHAPLPMHSYMRSHMARLSPEVQRLTIYDQLNPTWAKYYSREEAEDLLLEAGFSNVRSHNRHGYSWTVIGQKTA